MENMMCRWGIEGYGVYLLDHGQDPGFGIVVAISAND